VIVTFSLGTQQYEVSVINAGMFFDLELPLAWKTLAGRQLEQIDRLWLYIFP